MIAALNNITTSNGPGATTGQSARVREADDPSTTSQAEASAVVSLSPQAAVVAVDAYEPGSLSQLSSWLQPGSTVAVAGAGHGWFVDMIAEGDEAAGPMRLRCSAWGGWIVDLGPASMPAAVERDASCEPSAAVVELSFDLAS